MVGNLDNDGFFEALAASPSLWRKWLAVEVLSGEPDWSDAAEISHMDAGFAAEEAAEKMNEGDPPRNRRIAVKPAEGGETRVFDVEFEISVSYWAHEAEELP